MRFARMEYDSPIGPLTLVGCDGVLHVLAFPNGEEEQCARLLRQWKGAVVEPVTSLAAIGAALDAYFAGDIRALDRVAVHASGTPFQQRVWARLRAIAPAATETYAAIARAIGAATAVRAVGAANGANPLAIVLPCHRVVGSDGSLTGYGGGLERKRWLLEHEQRFAGQQSLAVQPRL